MNERHADRRGDRGVIMFIAGGCMAIILSIIGAMAFATLPDWAESLFSGIAGGAVVKLADCLSALVALANGRGLERMGDQLGNTFPATNENPMPVTVTNAPTDPVPVEPSP